MLLSLVSRRSRSAPRLPRSSVAQEEHLTSEITVGMPHLGLLGLSESFLTRHAGNMHWGCLAKLIGRQSSEWADQVGRPIYASFICSSVRLFGGDCVGLDDQVHVRTCLIACKGTVAITRTTYFLCGVNVAEVELTSTFVIKNEFGGTVLSRGSPSFPLPENKNSFLVDACKERRRAVLDEAVHGRVIEEYRPNPRIDFNSAGFLYFSVIHDWFVRSDIANFAERSGARKTFYFGNLRDGDRIELVESSADLGLTLQRRKGDLGVIAISCSRWKDGAR